MTNIKLCGLTRMCDIEAVNALQPEYAGFVFAAGSRRYVGPDRALGLRRMLRPEISAVGVFVNEEPESVAKLLHSGAIDVVQLHGSEDGDYIRRLRTLTSAPIIQAFRIDAPQDVEAAVQSSADFILLDSGGGTGTAFDWQLLKNVRRPYFLAGGLSPGNVSRAIELLHPYAVDVSSGIETNRLKDAEKMRSFVRAVRDQA